MQLRLEFFAIAVIGGALLWTAATYESLGILLGPGYALLALPATCLRWRRPILCFALGYWGFAYAINQSLVSYAWFAWVLLPILLTWHYFVLALLARVLWRFTQLPAWLVLPLAAGAEEWFRPLLGVGDYNMYQAGTFLFKFPAAIQIADVIGGLGLTVLWMVVLGTAVEWMRWKLFAEPGASRKTVLSGAITSTVIVTIVLAYGGYRLRTIELQNGPVLAVVQASADHTIESTPTDVRLQTELTRRLVPNNTVAMIIWPENAIFTPYEHEPEYQQVIRELAVEKRAVMLFGTQSVGPDGKRPTASSFLVDRTGKLLGRYDKMLLFPFTERRSFAFLEHVWPWLDTTLQELTRTAWGSAPNGWPGQQVNVMQLEESGHTWKFYTPLCYDSCAASLGRDAARQGAQFFVNMTSEGWNGWGISNNQLAVNTLRAVENRVGVVRAGNSGPSCLILPNGIVDEYLIGIRYHRKRLDQGVLVRSVRVSNETPTIYSRHGGKIDALWPVAWLALTLSGILRRHRGNHDGTKHQSRHADKDAS